MPATCVDRRFWVAHALLPLLAWCVITGLFEFTEWDLLLSDPFYDATRGGWYLKKSWWAESVIHQGGRYLILAIGLGALCVQGWGCFRAQVRPWRRAALYLALCIAFGTGLTALGKAAINRHSPWSYDRYGGKIPYVRLIHPPVSGYPVGHGFPAGHASGGYALMGSYFIFYRRNLRLALIGLLLGVSIGTLFAFGQQARGAHFASHNLWTILICWVSALILYTLIFQGKLLEAKQCENMACDADSGTLDQRVKPPLREGEP